jgi:DtxR family Mn-dependent transcriptional regulator
MESGKSGTIAGVKDSSTQFLQYLDKIGIGIGSSFRIVEKISFDQSVEMLVDNRKILVSRDVAANLFSME